MRLGPRFRGDDEKGARVGVSVFAALLMLAQAGAAEEATDCNDARTQMDMNLCAARDFEAADALLNEQWAETSELMKALDAEIDREFDSQAGHFETLLDGQRAWLKFRDAHCLADSFLARGGSMQPMLVSFCKAHLSQQRTQQLRELTDSLSQQR